MKSPSSHAGLPDRCSQQRRLCASSSDWFETEGARDPAGHHGQADAEGRLNGMLDIELKPGWKTYWRDPGDAGVPPTIDVSASQNIVGARVRFPGAAAARRRRFQMGGLRLSGRLAGHLHAQGPRMDRRRSTPACFSASARRSACRCRRSSPSIRRAIRTIPMTRRRSSAALATSARPRRLISA